MWRSQCHHWSSASNRTWTPDEFIEEPEPPPLQFNFEQIFGEQSELRGPLEEVGEVEEQEPRIHRQCALIRSSRAHGRNSAHRPSAEIITFTSSSADCWVGIVAQVDCYRRSWIQTKTGRHHTADTLKGLYLDKASSNAIDKKVMEWWTENYRDGRRGDWYAKYMGSDAASRNERSHQKSWAHSVFGKDWFYRLFLTFGCITNEIVDCQRCD